MSTDAASFSYGGKPTIGNEQQGVPADEKAAWLEHNLSQLRYFHALSLRQKLEAVEGMADVIRRFREMRAQGRFYTASSR